MTAVRRTCSGLAEFAVLFRIAALTDLTACHPYQRKE